MRIHRYSIFLIPLALILMSCSCDDDDMGDIINGEPCDRCAVGLHCWGEDLCLCPDTTDVRFYNFCMDTSSLVYKNGYTGSLIGCNCYNSDILFAFTYDQNGNIGSISRGYYGQEDGTIYDVGESFYPIVTSPTYYHGEAARDGFGCDGLKTYNKLIIHILEDGKYDLTMIEFDFIDRSDTIGICQDIFEPLKPN